jgi:hypothetical protein
MLPLVTMETTPQDYIPYRTNALHNQYTDGRMCIMDACNSAMGRSMLRAALIKRAHFGRKQTTDGDCGVPDVMEQLKREKSPFRFERSKLTWPIMTQEAKEGIYVVRLNFIDGNNAQDKHFLVVDCWRRLILDNAERSPIPFAGHTAKALMKRIQCAAFEKAWQCMVRSFRLKETLYV